MNKRMTVTILTPIHNLSLDLLPRTMASIKGQVSDAYELEWLIAVHNMDDAYMREVRKITASLGFARVLSLNEPLKCISCVRNFLLDHTDSDYFFWLDADDEMDDGFIPEAVSKMLESGADMTVFPVNEVVEKGAERFGKVGSVINGMPYSVYDKGDVRMYELIDGLSREVYSWGYRTDAVKKTGIRFVESARTGFCETPFLARLICAVNRICVTPLKKRYIYHRSMGTDSRSKVDNIKVFLGYNEDLLDSMLKVNEENGGGFDNFLWGCISMTFLIFFRNESISRADREKLVAKISDTAGRIRVLREPVNLSPFEMKMVAESVKTLNFGQNGQALRPKWKHMLLDLSTATDMDALRAKLSEASASYEGFRTVSDPTNPYRGIVKERTCIGSGYVDISKKSTEEQKKIISGYRNVEEVRGFENEEARLRVTVFGRGKRKNTILFTWDDRFLSQKAVDWLVDKWIR